MSRVNNSPNLRVFLVLLTMSAGVFLVGCTLTLPSEASLDFDPQSFQEALASRKVKAEEVDVATVRAIHHGRVISSATFRLSDGAVNLEVPTGLELEFVLEAKLKKTADGISSWGFHNIVYLPNTTERFKLDAPLRPLTSYVVVPKQGSYLVFDKSNSDPDALKSSENGPFATPIGYDKSARLLSYMVKPGNNQTVDYQYLVPAVKKPLTVALPNAPATQLSIPINSSPSWDFSSWFVLQNNNGTVSLLETPRNNASGLPSNVSNSLVNSRNEPFNLEIVVPSAGGVTVVPDLSAMVGDSEGFWYLSGRYNYTGQNHKLNFGFVLKLEVVPSAGNSLAAKWRVIDSYPESVRFTYDAQRPYSNDIRAKDLLVRGPYLYVLDAGVASLFPLPVRAAKPLLYRLDRKSLNLDRTSENYSAVVKSPQRFVNQHGWLLTVESVSKQDDNGNIFQVGFDLVTDAVWYDYEVPDND